MNRIIVQLEQGKLTLPYRAEIAKAFGEDIAELSTKMFEAMWHHYLLNKGSISLPYWSQKFNNTKVFNQILRELSLTGWIICETIPSRNWSEARLNEDKLLEFVTLKQLEGIRAYHKFQKYMLTQTEATKDNLTRINGKVRHTGLTRKGFAKSSKTQFQFDRETIAEYYDVIVEEVNKGMVAVRKLHREQYNKDINTDSASYDSISTTIVDHILSGDYTYSSGQFHSDSRGRNISGMLDKVFNPIGFKVARACLVIPEQFRKLATDRGVRNKYLFIAEINGFKKGTVEDKVNFGRSCYYKSTMLDLNPNDVEDRKHFYENIWLYRIYKELDNYFKANAFTKARFANGELTLAEAKTSIEATPTPDYKWSVPIEIDMSASVLGYVGLLTNHKPFLERCNMLGDELVDAWDIKGIKQRDQAKVIMRTIYGSSASCQDMWTAEEISFTQEDIKAYNEALTTGEIAVGDRLSKFIINNCNPSEFMKLHVRDEQFEIECNRYKRVGEKTISYDIYDSESKLYRRIHHTETRKVADLDQFRRFMVTGLIHNLDSQVEDTTTEAVYDYSQWVIDIHDALILDAESADFARQTYASELESIHTHRRSILTNYFRSIGIPATAIAQWKEVEKVVEPLIGEFKCNPMVLK